MPVSVTSPYRQRRRASLDSAPSTGTSSLRNTIDSLAEIVHKPFHRVHCREAAMVFASHLLRLHLHNENTFQIELDTRG